MASSIKTITKQVFISNGCEFDTREEAEKCERNSIIRSLLLHCHEVEEHDVTVISNEESLTSILIILRDEGISSKVMLQALIEDVANR